jgi:predicted membrane-bound spermidine synthase
MSSGGQLQTRHTLHLRAYDATILLVSANALALEIVAGRSLAPYIGMSLYSWTAVIAVVLAGLSVGHWIGGLLAAPATDHQRASTYIGLASALAASAALMSLPLLHWLNGLVLSFEVTPVLATLALATPAFFLPSLFAGVIAPLITQLALQLDRKHSGRVLGRIYALGAMGSIAGTLISGYLFIGFLGTTRSVLVIAIGFALLACAFLLPRPRVLAAALAGLVAVTATLWVGSGQGAAFSSPCDRESSYHCLRLLDYDEQLGRPARLLVLDHIGHGINDRDDPGRLYWTHLHFIDEFARRHFSDGNFSTMVLGGGSYTLPRAWLKSGFGKQIQVVEIDPIVTQIARDQLWVPVRKRLHVEHRDARLGLRLRPENERYDLVIGDAIRDLTVPYHLVTDEFNTEIKRRLRHRGYYILNAVDSRRTPRFVPSLIKTLAERFSVVEVWVETERLQQDQPVTYILVAGAEASGIQILRARQGLPRSWTRLMPQDKVFQAASIVLTDDYAPVERMMSDNLLRSSKH